MLGLKPVGNFISLDCHARQKLDPMLHRSDRRAINNAHLRFPLLIELH